MIGMLFLENIDFRGKTRVIFGKHRLWRKDTRRGVEEAPWNPFL